MAMFDRSNSKQRQTTSTIGRKNKVAGNLRNCQVCGGVFVAAGNERICAECLANEQDDRNKVMDYVRDNPGVSFDDAAKATGVSEKILKRMILEGEFITKSSAAVTTVSNKCVDCGRPIGGNGIYCKRCASRHKRDAQNMVSQSTDTVTQKKFGEMNTIDRLNRQAALELEAERQQRKRNR